MLNLSPQGKSLEILWGGGLTSYNFEGKYIANLGFYWWVGCSNRKRKLFWAELYAECFLQHSEHNHLLICAMKKRYLREVCYLFIVIINNAQKNIFMMFLQARLEAFGTHHRFVLKCWIVLYFQEYTYLTFENGMYKKALNFKYFKYFKYFVFAFTYMYSGSVCCVFE